MLAWTGNHPLHNNRYHIDGFLAAADPLIATHTCRINLRSHDADGIDTVRNPLWSVYRHVDRTGAVVHDIKRVAFKTGDTIGIDVGDRPTVTACTP